MQENSCTGKNLPGAEYRYIKCVLVQNVVAKLACLTDRSHSADSRAGCVTSHSLPAAEKGPPSEVTHTVARRHCPRQGTWKRGVYHELSPVRSVPPEIVYSLFSDAPQSTPTPPLSSPPPHPRVPLHPPPGGPTPSSLAQSRTPRLSVVCAQLRLPHKPWPLVEAFFRSAFWCVTLHCLTSVLRFRQCTPRSVTSWYPYPREPYLAITALA